LKKGEGGECTVKWDEKEDTFNVPFHKWGFERVTIRNGIVKMGDISGDASQ